MLAHGFASPRHRGFARIGNQQFTDSAQTIAHAENAGKSAHAGDMAAGGVASVELFSGDVVRNANAPRTLEEIRSHFRRHARRAYCTSAP
jgi:hypothetical protein